jgi:hypothetical protein
VPLSLARRHLFLLPALPPALRRPLRQPLPRPLLSVSPVSVMSYLFPPRCAPMHIYAFLTFSTSPYTYIHDIGKQCVSYGHLFLFLARINVEMEEKAPYHHLSRGTRKIFGGNFASSAPVPPPCMFSWMGPRTSYHNILMSLYARNIVAGYASCVGLGRWRTTVVTGSARKGGKRGG